MIVLDSRMYLYIRLLLAGANPKNKMRNEDDFVLSTISEKSNLRRNFEIFK